MAANPMKSWDAGLCVDAIRVEEIADELRAALAPTPPEPPRAKCWDCGGKGRSPACGSCGAEAAAVPLKEPCGTCGGTGLVTEWCESLPVGKSDCFACNGTGRTPEVTR